MNNSSELYYLVGKPSQLKHQVMDTLLEITKSDPSIVVVKTITTDEMLKSDRSYDYVSEADFMLMQNMGLYCLDWQKKGLRYGVSGEINQYLNKGMNVILNGSLQNVERALKQFPMMNVVFVKHENMDDDQNLKGYPLTENENARLDWVTLESDIHCPFVLNSFTCDEHKDAANLLVDYMRKDQDRYAKAI